MSDKRVECPGCRGSLRHRCDVTLVGFTSDGPLVDLILECECGATFNAFLPLSDFLCNPLNASDWEAK